MKDEHAQFSGSVPAAYDRYLGPMFFQPYVEDLLARWAGWPSSRSLADSFITRLISCIRKPLTIDGGMRVSAAEAEM